MEVQWKLLNERASIKKKLSLGEAMWINLERTEVLLMIIIKAGVEDEVDLA